MGKVQFRDDPTEVSQIQVDQGLTQGSPQGLGFDELGGFEFQTDSLLFRETGADVGLELKLDYILLEDGFSRILLEDESGIIQMELDSA